jgi:hypothetical protein
MFMIGELESFIEPTRFFQYDYVLFDAIFLGVWLFFLIRDKKWEALSFGLVCAIIVYFIDAIWWWNTPANGNYPPGTYIREYWINDMQMPHPLGGYFWRKLSCDFMMCISYSLFAFPWMWMMYEKISKKTSVGSLEATDKKEIQLYTGYYFGAWIAIPFLTLLIPFDNAIVHTVRHMNSQLIVWMINLIIGYFLLTTLYGTNIIKRKKPKIIGYVFIVGCAESFFMEFPLFISRIRPTGPLFLLFEIIFLVNQGAPYLYIAYDLVIPELGKQIRRLRNN